MKFSHNFLHVFATAAAWVALVFGSAGVFAAVQAPPLPVGSAQVRIIAGQSPVEQRRMERAHKHHSPAHHKKDMTRDDTLDGTSSSRRYGSDVQAPAVDTKNIPR